MKRAWIIYKTLQGSHIAKLKMAMKMAWSEHNNKFRIIELYNELVEVIRELNEITRDIKKHIQCTMNKFNIQCELTKLKWYLIEKLNNRLFKIKAHLIITQLRCITTKTAIHYWDKDVTIANRTYNI